MDNNLGHPLGCWDVAVDDAERKTTDALGTLARLSLHFIVTPRCDYSRRLPPRDLIVRLQRPLIVPAPFVGTVGRHAERRKPAAGHHSTFSRQCVFASPCSLILP